MPWVLLGSPSAGVEAVMGPIEMELRKRSGHNDDMIGLSPEGLAVLRGAAKWLHTSVYTIEDQPDIFSEAIVAAEALGL